LYKSLVFINVTFVNIFRLLFIGLALNIGLTSVVFATNCNTVEENSASAISKIECNFLLQFYRKTGGETSWNQKDGWLKNNKLCNWYGIDCDTNGHIIEIDLSRNNLYGMIPHFNDLSHLKYLDISNNNQLCKHQNIDYYDQWQSEINNYPNCGMVADFKVSDNYGSVFRHQDKTIPFKVTVDADITNFVYEGKIEHYKWVSIPDNGQILPDQERIEITYTEPKQYMISLVVSDEYGTESTVNAKHIITVRDGKYRLTVDKNGSGDVTGAGSYLPDKEVTLYVTPDTHSVFNKWLGCLTEGINPPSCIVKMDKSKKVTATFDLDSHSLEVQSNEGGTVSGNNSDTYKHGTEVTLTARPKDNWSFVNWSDDNCSSTDSCVVVMDKNRNVTATFLQEICPLNIDLEGNGTVSCNGSACKSEYKCGEEIKITINPDNDYDFDKWSGDCSGKDCRVTLDKNGESVTATFIKQSKTLTININNGDTGTVSSSPTGINNCSYQCEKSYEYDTKVTLTATPKTNYNFTGWSGVNCHGIEPCTVTMDKVQTVTATFSPIEKPILTVTKDAGCTVNASGISCGFDCNEDYSLNDNIDLIANSDENYEFMGWSVENGSCEGTGICSITMAQNQHVHAKCSKLPKLTVTINSSDKGIVKDNSDFYCDNNTCEQTYPVGNTEVCLTAQPINDDFIFDN